MHDGLQNHVTERKKYMNVNARECKNVNVKKHMNVNKTHTHERKYKNKTTNLNAKKHTDVKKQTNTRT